MRIGLIGFGAIGQAICAAWPRSDPALSLAALLVRPHQLAPARAAVPRNTLVTSEPDAFFAANLDTIAEAAGQGAVRTLGPDAVRACREFLVISAGALADPALHAALTEAARLAGSCITVPAGAIAGLDGLAAMRRAGLLSVRYTSTKPPRAWKNTQAESLLDLDALREPACFFTGRADEAALAYPQNANLAAVVAMAGLGFERTEVRLVADPAASGNTGQIEAQTAATSLTVTVGGHASASNPKTSAITAMSILATLERGSGLLRIG